MHDLIRDAMAYQTEPPVAPGLNYAGRPSWVTNVMDATTWTYRRDEVPGVGHVITSWHPWPFAPAYGLDGTKKHIQSLVTRYDDGPNDEVNYVTEQEAIDGHARLLSVMQAIAAVLP